MSVELPKDAKGREIPLNADALYSKDGIRMPVFGWKYINPRSRKWMVQFRSMIPIASIIRKIITSPSRQLGEAA